MSYRGFSNIEVYMEIERLAKEVGVVQILPEVLQCGSCFQPLYLAESIHRMPILHKRALNKPAHDDGSAIAYLCGKCKDENKEPVMVLHKEGSQRRRCLQINIEDLPDKINL
jgi:hypothetical protein